MGWIGVKRWGFLPQDSTAEGEKRRNKCILFSLSPRPLPPPANRGGPGAAFFSTPFQVTQSLVVVRHGRGGGRVGLFDCLVLRVGV